MPLQVMSLLFKQKKEPLTSDLFEFTSGYMFRFPPLSSPLYI